MPRLTAVLVPLALLPGVGCSSPPAERADRPRDTQPLTLSPSADPGPRVEPGRADDRQAAVIDGQTVAWDRVRPLLVEAGGAAVLGEIALDQAIDRELARRGLSVAPDDAQAEEDALLDELASVAPGQTRAEVLDEIRRNRGLGPARYQALLRRNAALRAMVRTEAAPTETELELARRLAFGPTRRVRLFVSPSEFDAAQTRADAAGRPADQRGVAFAQHCFDASVHPSASRGGLIERFHADDPAYPDVVGDAARALQAGGVSPVLATPAGFAVVLVEAINPGTEATPDEARRVERRVRVRKERLAMERLARDLLSRTRVSPVDPDLARAWRDRPQQ